MIVRGKRNSKIDTFLGRETSVNAISISKTIKTRNCKNSIFRVTFSAHQEIINDPFPPLLDVSQPDQQV